MQYAVLSVYYHSNTLFVIIVIFLYQLQPTTTTPYTGPTTPTTTPKPDNCAKYGSCTMDQDGQGPYHAEGPCEQCFCQCVAAGFYSEVCCQPGLLFNESIEECDFPTNMPDCN